jgi:hypothetical protein
VSASGRHANAHYTEEQLAFLREHVSGRSYEKLALMFNKKFGTSACGRSIGRACRLRGWSNGKPKRPYSGEEIDFLRRNVAGVDYATLADMFNARFGTSISAGRVGDLCRRKGFANGLDCRYKTGHTEGVGRKMPNSLPDGSEYVNATGYIMQKHNGAWQFKHILLWEQANGRSVPEGHYIVFGDSDKRNFAVVNLFCITAAQNAIRSKHGLQGATPELAAAGVALAKLYSRIGERKKSRKKKPQKEASKNVQNERTCQNAR